MPAQPVVSIIDGNSRPPATILQSELDYTISIRNRIASLLEQLEEIEAEIFIRRKHGARVEPGPHIAHIKREFRGRRHTERLVIK